MSAKITEIAKQINHVAIIGLLIFCETWYAVTPKMKKLYGQISPKTKSGGCQGGRTSEVYQPGEVFTQMPEPTA